MVVEEIYSFGVLRNEPPANDTRRRVGVAFFEARVSVIFAIRSQYLADVILYTRGRLVKIHSAPRISLGYIPEFFIKIEDGPTNRSSQLILPRP